MAIEAITEIRIVPVIRGGESLKLGEEQFNPREIRRRIPNAVSVSRRFPVCNAKSNFYQWEILRKLIPRLDNAARYYDSDYSERITSAIEYRGSSRDSVTSPCRVSSSGCACGRGAKRSTKIKCTFIYQTLVVNALGKSRADVGIILLDLTS